MGDASSGSGEQRDDPLAGATPQERKFLEGLLPRMRAEGVNVPPEMANLAPEVYLGPVKLQIAADCAEVLRHKDIFLMGDEIVTIENGVPRVMTPHAFVTWLDQHVVCYKFAKEAKQMQSMGPDLARIVLESVAFRVKLRPLTGINKVKLPVWREEKVPPAFAAPKDEPVRYRKFPELLQPGYDPETGIYTLQGGLDYPEDVPLKIAEKGFRAMLGTFPWGDGDRSLAVHMAMMLTLFCQGMLGRARSPAFAYNSNLQGSGKSLLGMMPLIALYGEAEVTPPLLEKEHAQEFKKVLDMVALDFAPYLFIDNIRGKIMSTALEAWGTAPMWSGRLMNTQRKFRVPVRAVTILSGNEITFNSDFARRVVMAHLFAEQTAAEREAPVMEITVDWLRQDEVREQLLAFMWAMVREAWTPEEETGESRAGKVRMGKPLSSFEVWSRLVAPMVQVAGFGDPLAEDTMPGTGDLEEDDAKVLIHAVIERERKKQPFVIGGLRSLLLPSMMPVALDMGLFTGLLTTVEEIISKLDGKRDGWREQEYQDSGELSGVSHRKPETYEEKRAQALHHCDEGKLQAFAKYIRKRAGRQFTVSGETYSFGAQNEKRKSTFTIKRVG